VLLLFSLIYYFVGDIELLEEVSSSAFYDLRNWFYRLLVRARFGPFHAIAAQFRCRWAVGGLPASNNAVVLRGRNGVDVFPSLHCAISSFFLCSLTGGIGRGEFRLYLVPAWPVALHDLPRYHYFIDVLCGFALAAFALWLATAHPPAALPRTGTMRTATTTKGCVCV